MATRKFVNQVFDTIYDCKVQVKFTDRTGREKDMPASEARMFYYLHNMKKCEFKALIDECGAMTLEEAVRGIVRAVLSMWGGRREVDDAFILKFKEQQKAA